MDTEDWKKLSNFLNQFEDVMDDIVKAKSLQLIPGRHHDRLEAAWNDLKKTGTLDKGAFTKLKDHYEKVVKDSQEKGDTREEISQYQLHGFSGHQAAVKYGYVNHCYEEVRDCGRVIDMDSKDLGLGKRVRKWVLKFLGGANTLLGSLSAINPAAWPVKEVKEITEGCVRVVDEQYSQN